MYAKLSRLIKSVIPWPWAQRFIKFGIVGAVGVIVDNAIFLLVQWIMDNKDLFVYVGPLISYEVAMFNNYLLSGSWVWRDRKHSQKGRFFINLMKYNFTTVIPFILRMFVFVPLAKCTDIPLVISNIIAICFGMCFNFLMADKWIFKKWQIPPDEEHDQNTGMSENH